MDKNAVTMATGLNRDHRLVCNVQHDLWFIPPAADIKVRRLERVPALHTSAMPEVRSDITLRIRIFPKSSETSWTS